MPELTGTTLGRYKLQGRLGHGGMSEVYLAYDEHRQCQVAIKVVGSSNSDYIERFHREADAISILDHAHILPAVDYGEQGPWHYIVMPYIKHGTLRDRLVQGPLSLEEAGMILEQVGGALQFAHEQGIIHRDIKPSNILLRDDHYAYLADFGLAKSLEEGSTITQTGNLLGTPEYMAPELAEGPATTSSDLYALGILLYQMVAGQLPFSGETPIAVYWKQIRDEPPPPSQINPAIPRAVERVILRALDKQPGHRYQSANELVQAYLNAITFPDRVEETERADASPAASRQREMETPALPVQASKLILPNNPVAAPAATAQKRRAGRRMLPNGMRRRYGRAAPALPPLEPLSPMQLQDFVPSSSSASEHVARPVRTRRRTRPVTSQRLRRRNPVLLSIIIIGILLLVIVLIALPFTYFANQSNARLQMAIATVNAQATSSARAFNVKATQQAQATATADVARTATSGAVLFADPLTGNSGNHWPENLTCSFVDNSYHVLVQQTNFVQICPLNALTIDNAAIEVDVSLLAGSDTGLIFRANGNQFYDFEITSQGEYFLRRHNSGTGASYTYLIQNTKSTAIAQGNNKNTLLIIASGDDFKLFINNIFVGETHDDSLASGQLGLVTGTLASSSSGEASFSNLKVFKP
ncbi:MAG: serine/threonine protein kinase [Ktedonobacteraceae bacterium]